MGTIFNFYQYSGTKRAHDGSRRVTRSAEGWLLALNGHTLSRHGKEGKIDENCPACIEITKRMKEAGHERNQT